jgi:hypothetical protein
VQGKGHIRFIEVPKYKGERGEKAKKQEMPLLEFTGGFVN